MALRVYENGEFVKLGFSNLILVRLGSEKGKINYELVIKG